MAQCIRLNPPLLKSYSRARGNHPAGKWCPPTTTSRAFHFALSFQTGGSRPWSGRRLSKGWAHAVGLVNCPCNCHDHLGKALWAVIQHCPGEVQQQQQRAWLSTRELRLLFDRCFCFPSCETVKEKSPLSQLTFASELIFADRKSVV